MLFDRNYIDIFIRSGELSAINEASNVGGINLKMDDHLVVFNQNISELRRARIKANVVRFWSRLVRDL